ncbi:MAG: Holliday junction branch migration protein RuvA [Deltaproteobacteria bacterium]|nr:Holliday junction branch migration protein RuvA [Deltaproteobacteria bacterium]
MIAHLRGEIILKSPETIVLDVAGVGYEVFIPLSTFYHLPELHEKTSLNIHTAVTDDSIRLYGFYTTEEKNMFRLLISVSGIGPRLACNILSGISVPDLANAVANSDIKGLRTVPGLGQKTSERLALELKDKVKLIAGSGKAVYSKTGGMEDDLVSALLNLGYKAKDAEEAIKKAMKECPENARFETMFKAALKMLSARKQ